MSKKQNVEVLFQQSHAPQLITKKSGGEISVIIPLFKPDLVSLRTAISSVLNQTYLASEILCVSDGIPLESEVSIFLNSIEGLRVIELPSNVGQGSARNRGMEVAAGEWVAFLDQDDYWFPQHLEYLITECVQRSCTFAYTDIAFVNKDSLLINASSKNLLTSLNKFEPIKQTIASVFLHDLIIFPTSALIHKQSALGVGGFGEGYRGYEDDYLFGKLILKFGDHAFIDEVTCAWRSHFEGTSLSLSMSKSRILYAEFLQECLKKMEIDKGTVSPENIFERFYPLILSEFHGSYFNQNPNFLDFSNLCKSYLTMSAKYVKLSIRQRVLVFLISHFNQKFLFRAISNVRRKFLIFKINL